jgi:transposase
VTGNVAKMCRYYGITRQAYYTWVRRYEEQGLEGLRDRSRRPHTSPNATKAEVVGKIVYFRRSYHFGPHKIAMYLKRYQDVGISPSGIWRNPQAPGHEPAALLPALPPTRRPMEALREAPARAPGPDV